MADSQNNALQAEPDAVNQANPDDIFYEMLPNALQNQS